MRTLVPETWARQCLSESVDGALEEKRIQRLIQEKCSDQLKLQFVLWRVAVVQELI